MIADPNRRGIGRNILANAVGGSWTILLSLAVIPIQIGILGADAFGLLALIGSLQVLLNSMDLGLSPTISREVAIDNSPNLQQSRELLQTLSVAYIGIGVLLGAVVIAGSDWLVSHWLNLGGLPAESASAALKFTGLTIALRWPVSFFAGVLTGRRRFDILNLLRVSVSTVQQVGGALVVIAFANLVMLTAWTALIALLEVALFLIASFRLVPGLSLRPRVSRRALARVRHFAVGMSFVRVLNIAISQSDHFVLGVLAPIETLGYYALAYRVLSGLTKVQRFVTTALFPSFAAAFVQGAKERLVSDYNRSSQGLVYLSTPLIAALIFFGGDLLSVWTSPDTAAQAAPILHVLAPGFLLGGSVAIATTLAVSTANVSMVIRRNVVGLAIYLPMLVVAILRWGALGAAGAWFIINLSFLFTLLPLVQARIIGQSTMSWLTRNLLPFLALGVLSFGVGRGVLEIGGWHGYLAAGIVCAVATVTYGVWGVRLLYPELRRHLWNLFGELSQAAGYTLSPDGLLHRFFR